ncbi:hypothetical protein EHI8A_152200 [Entamoeba histolytica HM-1:IMSS-B]|uniref:Tetraspanin family protein n=6 Tax=Entamoeba histolytica TaxID=5759 RepID=C4M133_ENTH1|nr:hypothetical protein EHI_105290 [Entamoeba histolytica HM-1:IMSS]EMD42468.1 Hypothetical protein EHI5A_068360 [Entamoeba histolytica KU27]EMH76291.1 hypothetical protein EHI8A_152200 [Entamoeba histolytica HM-1:IMSS-B]EMS11463.1 hypothetical protein KM1_085860 [Entamoeba histolytica HM-3:IMSS]ENY64574.1 hypothetical protein EHI7A_137060 [Entamoeba histolytica HM-1:IMSS-A]GAT94906.1 hypothetical protein CL6EHI_105290 [Entamoeba histolytica]|eukprot:XP_653940.2 hypothetical protein EHI_105290 [Entamoeba histolytica HM-1:IMSS]
MKEVFVLGTLSALFTIACLYSVAAIYGISIHWTINKNETKYRLMSSILTLTFGIIGVVFHFFATVFVFYNKKEYRRIRKLFIILLFIETIIILPLVILSWVGGAFEVIDVENFTEVKKHGFEKQFHCCYVFSNGTVQPECSCLYDNHLSFTTIKEMENDGTCTTCGNCIETNSTILFYLCCGLNTLFIVSNICFFVCYTFVEVRRCCHVLTFEEEIQLRMEQLSKQRTFQQTTVENIPKNQNMTNQAPQKEIEMTSQ